MLATCPECKKEISGAAAACPQCGHPFPQPAGEGLVVIAYILAVVFPIAGVVAGAFLCGRRRRHLRLDRSHRDLYRPDRSTYNVIIPTPSRYRHNP